MTTHFVIDTHPLLCFLAGDKRLGSSARQIMEADDSILIIPAIVVAQACWITEYGRITAITAANVFETILRDPRIKIYPLDLQIVERCATLHEIPEMHDRQIVATTLAIADGGLQVFLVSRDEIITSTAIVPTKW